MSVVSCWCNLTRVQFWVYLGLYFHGSMEGSCIRVPNCGDTFVGSLSPVYGSLRGRRQEGRRLAYADAQAQPTPVPLDSPATSSFKVLLFLASVITALLFYTLVLSYTGALTHYY